MGGHMRVQLIWASTSSGGVLPRMVLLLYQPFHPPLRALQGLQRKSLGRMAARLVCSRHQGEPQLRMLPNPHGKPMPAALRSTWRLHPRHLLQTCCKNQSQKF